MFLDILNYNYALVSQEKNTKNILVKRTARNFNNQCDNVECALAFALFLKPFSSVVALSKHILVSYAHLLLLHIAENWVLS